MVNADFDTKKQDCIKSPLGDTIQAIQTFCYIRKERVPKLTQQAFAAFHRHFYNLCLILERIKEENDKLIVERKENKDPREVPDYYYFLLLDLETFFIYLRVIMDDIAGITPYFFGKHRGKIASGSFNDLKQWFVKQGGRLDSEFSRYLKEETAWFDEMKKEREAIIHYKANNIIFYCGEEIQYQNT